MKDLQFETRRTGWKAKIKAVVKDCRVPGSNYEQQVRLP